MEQRTQWTTGRESADGEREAFELCERWVVCGVAWQSVLQWCAGLYRLRHFVGVVIAVASHSRLVVAVASADSCEQGRGGAGPCCDPAPFGVRPAAARPARPR